MIQLARPVPSESPLSHKPLAGVPGSEPDEDVSAETRALGAAPTSAPAAEPAPASAPAPVLESGPTRPGLTDGPTDPAFALAAACTGVTPRQRKNVVLGDEIARLSAHIQAATGRLLDLIRAFEASEGWYEEGFKSCAQWLSWRTGIAPGAAREKVRVARALGGLPELSAALGSGQLSYSVARALTRVATAENEAELVEVARHATAADMERLVRAWQVADRSEADERERHALRYLWVVPEADGSWMVRGRLDPEVGAVLSRALEAAEETLRATYTTESREADCPESRAQARRRSWTEHPAEARRADAIGLVAEAALGCQLGAVTGAGGGAERASAAGGAEGAAVVSRAERFQVVLHVSAETLAAEDEDETARAARIEPESVARIEPGPHVCAETARRLACDAGLVTMTRDRSGNVLDVGRRRRTVPAAIRRALDVRDRGCRFPGCMSRYCDAHHVKSWVDGGETKLDNLVLLCRHHHRRVHEGGWRLTLSRRAGTALGATKEVRFHRPDGGLVPYMAPRAMLPEEPAYDLERENGRIGIEIGPWTATPRWMGEWMDVDWALSTLGNNGQRTSLDVSAETSGSSAAGSGSAGSGSAGSSAAGSDSAGFRSWG